MGQDIFEVEYGGHPVRYAFRYPATRWRFRNYICRSNSETYDVLAPAERIEATRGMLPAGCGDDYAEYRSLISLTSRALLRWESCIIHAVAFLWRGRAWLLTAPSGTGKSTQFLNWQRLYPGEITMICGDMPALEKRPDGSVWIHPTSWNGKENLGSQISAPLSGIVLLEQDGVNEIMPLTPRQAIPPLLRQFIIRPDTEEQIRALAGILDGTLRSVPVWKLRNLGDDASTELLRRTLAQRQTGGSDNAL